MSAHNRASWVALRTLRQVPKVVGQTTTGEPVFEIRSVRLVLPDDAAHFSRLLACTQCGRDIPGPRVLTPGDLDQPPNTVLCPNCVNSVVSTTFGPREHHAGGAPGGAAEWAPGNGPGSRSFELRTGDARPTGRQSHKEELMEVPHRAEWEAVVEGPSRAMRPEDATLAAGASLVAGSPDTPARVVNGIVPQSPGTDVDSGRLGADVGRALGDQIR
ncbi:MAG: hypothetical protein M3450_17830, partial [Actinomycetota bacterium]|nr:hypothetical protein [Actinomycetota bacterium]